MSFFSRKKEEGKGYIPVKEIISMRKSGISDKDIIKKLKSENFSYREIEKGMLESLKHSVGPEPRMEETVEEPSENETPTLEDIYGKEEEPPGPSVDDLIAPGAEGEDISPELAMEELVEGVVNEKWEKFEKELESLKEDQETIIKKIKQIESIVSTTGKETKAMALEKTVSDIETRLTGLESRIGGLEKAFRQFLPSLTDNIKSLSNMIKELKTQKGIEEENETKF